MRNSKCHICSKSMGAEKEGYCQECQGWLRNLDKKEEK